MRCWMRGKNEAAVERQIEPLVSIGRPGVGGCHAGEQGAISFARRCPQTESAVNMGPSVCGTRHAAGLCKAIECPRVQITCLETDERRIFAECAYRHFELRDIHTPFVVGLN